MATPRKLKSGNWNVQVFDYTDENGKNHYKSFTAKSKYQCQNQAYLFLEEKKLMKWSHKTLNEAFISYIEKHRSKLSPTTIQSYDQIRRVSFEDLMELEVDKITPAIAQKSIDKEMRKTSRRGEPFSAKTIINRWGAVQTVIKSETRETIDVILPEREPGDIQMADPRIVLDAIIGSDVELPCLLAMWLSFTMSEIRGLKCSSIKNHQISINQVVVDIGKDAVEKRRAKAKTRNRTLNLPLFLEDKIIELDVYKNYLKTKEDGYLFHQPNDYFTPESAYIIGHHFKKLMKDINEPQMTFHKLRHLNASIMVLLGVPDKYMQERGGWANNSSIMASVYQHTFPKERLRVDAAIDNYFLSMLDSKE